MRVSNPAVSLNASLCQSQLIKDSILAQRSQLGWVISIEVSHVRRTGQESWSRGLGFESNDVTFPFQDRLYHVGELHRLKQRKIRVIPVKDFVFYEFRVAWRYQRAQGKNKELSL